MDLATDDHRAWTLAPHLVVVGAATELGRVDEPGDRDHLPARRGRRVRRAAPGGRRVTPVVAGQIMRDEAISLFGRP